MTIVITGTMVAVCLTIKSHYDHVKELLGRMDQQILEAGKAFTRPTAVVDNIESSREPDPRYKTAVLLVHDFNGRGLHMLESVLRLFPRDYKNFVFVQIGIMDSGNFKGMSELERLGEHTKAEVDKYVSLMRHLGYHAEGLYSLGTDVAEEVETNIVPEILKRFPQAVFFGAQLILPKYSFLSRLLDNYTVQVLQRRLNNHGIPFIIMPIQI